MCELCVKHGEGKKWYLNIKNYSYDLLSDASRRAFVKNHFFWIDKTYKKYNFISKHLPLNIPIVKMSFRAILKGLYLHKHWSQVLPIEDVEKILNFTNSITRAPCVCRQIKKGKKDERYCYFISLDPNKIGIETITDFSYFGKPDVAFLEKMEKEQTLNFMKECELKGMVHTVWAVKAPFAGILCNCDLKTGCLAMEMIKMDTPFTFRAEYIASVDEKLCNGCRACIGQCQFGAIRFDKTAKIDEAACYGCGICRAVCKKSAISLKSRTASEKVSDLW